MLENQAFGWLKNAITGGTLTAGSGVSKNRAAISSCSDVNALMTGFALDFASALHSASTPSEPASPSLPPPDAEDVERLAPEIDSSAEECLDELAARIDRIKVLLYEERSASSCSFSTRGSVNLNWVPQVATGVFKSFSSDHPDLLPEVIQNLSILPFEARKSVSAVYNYLLVCGLDGADAMSFASISAAFGTYVLQRAPIIIGKLVEYHDCSRPPPVGHNVERNGGGTGLVDITLLCGSMLRSSLRHAQIYQWALSDGCAEQLVYPFLDKYVHDPNFDVSSDALETVRVMFTGGASGSGNGGVDQAPNEVMEAIASEFLARKYDEVIDGRINRKCICVGANYMTRRMTLQLLSCVLLNRANYNIMMKYISSMDNLVTIMCLLRDPSPHITLDAFQVFKIFVANPSKPPEVVKILFDNKVKLVKYLGGLHKDREKVDEQYRDEKALVITTLEGLEFIES